MLGSMMTSACCRQPRSAWRWMMLKERLSTSVAVRGAVGAGAFEVDGDDEVGAEEAGAFGREPAK